MGKPQDKKQGLCLLATSTSAAIASLQPECLTFAGKIIHAAATSHYARLDISILAAIFGNFMIQCQDIRQDIEHI